MLTHDHDHFPSDIFVILEAAGATLNIGKPYCYSLSCNTELPLVNSGGGRYIFCGPMFVPGICFKPTQFQGQISPRFGTDLYFAKTYKRTILIS